MKKNNILELLKSNIKEVFFEKEIIFTINNYKDIIPKITVKGYGIYDVQNPDKNNNRYFLDLNIIIPEIKTDEKVLTTLMMNPSNTFPISDTRKKCSLDSTVQNVVKIAYICGFSRVIVLNTLPIINSKPDGALNNLQQQKNTYNKNFVQTFLSQYNGAFLSAWGGNKNINKYNEFIKTINDNSKLETQVFVYDTNSDGHPTHPSWQNHKQLIPFFTQFKQDENFAKLKPVKLNNDGTAKYL